MQPTKTHAHTHNTRIDSLSAMQWPSMPFKRSCSRGRNLSFSRISMQLGCGSVERQSSTLSHVVWWTSTCFRTGEKPRCVWYTLAYGAELQSWLDCERTDRKPALHRREANQQPSKQVSRYHGYASAGAFHSQGAGHDELMVRRTETLDLTFGEVQFSLPQQ